jgi:CheY-like chemotaxis protein
MFSGGGEQAGDEALWLAETNACDAMVLDVMMPGKDGFIVVRLLRRKQASTSVIFLTAWQSSTTGVAACHGWRMASFYSVETRLRRPLLTGGFGFICRR